MKKHFITVLNGAAIIANLYTFYKFEQAKEKVNIEAERCVAEGGDAYGTKYVTLCMIDYERVWNGELEKNLGRK